MSVFFDDHNHSVFLHWARRTPGYQAAAFDPETLLSRADRVSMSPSPTLDPHTTIELLIAAGHLIEQADGSLRRRT